MISGMSYAVVVVVVVVHHSGRVYIQTLVILIWLKLAQGAG